MKKYWITSTLVFLLVIVSSISVVFYNNKKGNYQPEVLSEKSNRSEYWFQLERKSKKEFFYFGIPGDKSKSELIKVFQVNVGIENERPTPLPQLLGKQYWKIIAKFDVPDDPETAPYFLTLDIPWSDEYPFGPSPYPECNGKQCDWVRPGSFGLHGTSGNPNKLTDSGSSGCIRHADEDITYLYNLLNPTESNPIRYYVEDI